MKKNIYIAYTLLFLLSILGATAEDPEAFGFTLEIKAKEFSNFKNDSTKSIFAFFSNENRESKKILPVYKEAASLYSKNQENPRVIFVIVLMDSSEGPETLGLKKIPSLRLFKKDGDQQVGVL